jgi:hypothetical protein
MIALRMLSSQSAYSNRCPFAESSRALGKLSEWNCDAERILERGDVGRREVSFVGLLLTGPDLGSDRADGISNWHEWIL